MTAEASVEITGIALLIYSVLLTSVVPTPGHADDPVNLSLTMLVAGGLYCWFGYMMAIGVL